MERSTGAGPRRPDRIRDVVKRDRWRQIKGRRRRASGCIRRRWQRRSARTCASWFGSGLAAWSMPPEAMHCQKSPLSSFPGKASEEGDVGTSLKAARLYKVAQAQLLYEPGNCGKQMMELTLGEHWQCLWGAYIWWHARWQVIFRGWFGGSETCRSTALPESRRGSMSSRGDCSRTSAEKLTSHVAR